MFKALLRRIIPEFLINLYHLCLARAAAFVYGHPSEKLIVIGVTGTNGKSSTTQFIGQLLEHAGFRVGWTTTASFKVADREWANDKKMTMLGRFQTQKLLRDMVRSGCTHAIVETSSQGVAQYRHVGINYDVAVFTNLTPEHIEAHRGFENYKKAKGNFFRHVARSRRKKIQGLIQPKISVVNLDDDHAPFFLSFRTDKQYGFARKEGSRALSIIPVVAESVALSSSCTTFQIASEPFHLNLIGSFNFSNALAAITVCKALGMETKRLAEATAKLVPIPGRLELIREGQPFSVIVDYAYEPAALGAVYEAIALIPHKRLIHIVGSAGGGRDVSRREVLGKMAAEHDDIVIVTNEDPYDEDPMMIINQVAAGALEGGKKEGVNLFRLLDRREAITAAIGLAREGDLVLITGKGSEPVMAVAGGKKIPWDDRVEARKALHEVCMKKISSN